MPTTADLLRWGWLLLALLGAARAALNLRNVARAREKIFRSGTDGVLRVRSKFTILDCAISCAALACGAIAGLAGFWMWPVVALGGLIAEHLLLVWLVFNMATGWYAVNRALLNESLEAKVANASGRVKATR